MNTLFKKSKDYKKVFTTNRLYCFDETAFAHDAFTAGKKYFEINTEIESMMHVVQKMEEKKYIKYYSDLHIIDGVPGKMRWDKGILTYRNKYEILLYHLILFKKGSLHFQINTFSNFQITARFPPAIYKTPFAIPVHSVHLIPNGFHRGCIENGF